MPPDTLTNPIAGMPLDIADARMPLVSEAFLGRQPIYDAKREIQAYELLYRGAASDTTAKISDADQASAEVMLKAFLEIGLQRVSPSRPVFINFSEPLLAFAPIIPQDRCVIEVLETVTASGGTIASLERLKKEGYRIALDDFEYRDQQIPFLKLADYVKLDVRVLAPAEFRRHVDLVRAYPARIIAEKVECEEEFERCRSWGCDLFQGYYLRRPETLSGKHVPANRLSVLALLSECMNASNNVDRIAAVLDRDAVLTYGLLQLANSALYQREREIRSPAQAITMLGMDFVFRWATLLVLAGYDTCPAGYLDFALQRARTCELLASSLNCQRNEAYFAGLLSTLDSILNMPLEEIISPLPLDASIKHALLDREGNVGAILEAVIAYESGQFGAALRSGINASVFQSAFWESVGYAGEMLANLRLAPERPA